MVPPSLLHKQLRKNVLNVLDGILLNLECRVVDGDHLNVSVILVVYGRACDATLLRRPFILCFFAGFDRRGMAPLCRSLPDTSGSLSDTSDCELDA